MYSRLCRSMLVFTGFQTGHSRAGIFLITALILYTISHIYIRWSTFPFEYRDIGSVYSGLWRRHVVFGGRLLTFTIRCAHERRPCAKLIIARIFMVLASVTSGIGSISLCLLPTSKARYKSLLYITGLTLAFLSFVCGLIGFSYGVSWVIQFEQDAVGAAAICALTGAFLSLISAICAFFINSDKLNN